MNNQYIPLLCYNRRPANIPPACLSIMSVRTRFAPSPTGFLHIGGARTALFCYLYARRHGGAFVLRIEDTDRERSTEASVQAILDGMEWLGLEADEGPFYQTHRFDRYREVVQQLLDAGQAYRCYCTPEELEAMRELATAEKRKPRYDGYWRDRDEAPPAGVQPVVRFRNPLEGEVVIDDAVKGRIVIDNRELDDLIIMRSDGTPTYNLTVVVDDMDMRITHVIRGDDHVNNTPRQINILRALDAELPVYAHLPMILGEDGKRLSKRHGAVSVMQYEADGYLPPALLNYLVRLGWAHHDQEIFSRDEMIDLFSFDAVNRSGAVFDTKKLDWVNQQYLQALDAQALGAALAPYLEAVGTPVSTTPPISEVADLLRDRARTLTDMAAAAHAFYAPPAQYDEAAAKKHLDGAAADVLQAVADDLAAVDPWHPDAIQAALKGSVERLGIKFGQVGLPLRVCLVGGTASPALDKTLALIGKAEVLQRIHAGVKACGDTVT